ncbi:hypothetical protein WA158_000950 [Blastocystis sp. Blastoise]
MNTLRDAKLLYFQEAPLASVIDKIKETPDWYSFENQEWIVNNIICDDLVKLYPCEESYKKRFIVLFNKAIEENDQVANDSLLIEYSKYLKYAWDCDERFYYTHFLVPKISEENINKPDKFVTCRVARTLNEVGLRIWEAGFSVAEWAIRNRSYFENKSILELGSGIGFTSLMLWNMIPIKKIIATEYPEVVLNTLKWNVEINEHHLDKSLTSCVPEVRKINFYDYDIDEINQLNFELILVADVVYEESIIDGLCNILYDLLRTDPEHKKKALVVCTLRNEKTFEYFLIEAQKKKLYYKELDNTHHDLWYYPNRSALRFVEITYQENYS